MAELNQRWPKFLGFGAVALIAAGTFGLGVKSFPLRLKAPFGLVSSDNPKEVSFESTLGDSEVTTAAKDTDRDGLTDAQELKVYNTSPFIPDTDSDGISDREEIEKGTDPNCPEGQDCRRLFAAFPSAREVGQEKIQKNLYETTVLSALQKFGLPGISDAQTVRTMLLQAGLQKEVIDQFSDEDLVELFKKAGEAPLPSPPPSPEGRGEAAGAGLSANALPQNPSAEDIRRLLIQGGLEKGVVDGLSNSQLIQVYQETLKEFESKE